VSQLLSQLGIDWHLLIAQAVNFFLLLVVLRKFVYQPLLTMLHDRRHAIEEGVVKAQEADRRLHEADAVGRAKIKEAESQAVLLLKQKEVEAKELEAKLLAEAKQKEARELMQAEAMLRAREEESRRALGKEAAGLVRRAIARTVELAPEKIDEALITQAINEAVTK
jgi:F-type H+-transporting ATPase subunit b